MCNNTNLHHNKYVIKHVSKHDNIVLFILEGIKSRRLDSLLSIMLTFTQYIYLTVKTHYLLSWIMHLDK